MRDVVAAHLAVAASDESADQGAHHVTRWSLYLGRFLLLLFDLVFDVFFKIAGIRFKFNIIDINFVVDNICASVAESKGKLFFIWRLVNCEHSRREVFDFHLSFECSR